MVNHLIKFATSGCIFLMFQWDSNLAMVFSYRSGWWFFSNSILSSGTILYHSLESGLILALVNISHSLTWSSDLFLAQPSQHIGQPHSSQTWSSDGRGPRHPRHTGTPSGAATIHSSSRTMSPAEMSWDARRILPLSGECDSRHNVCMMIVKNVIV